MNNVLDFEDEDQYQELIYRNALGKKTLVISSKKTQKYYLKETYKFYTVESFQFTLQYMRAYVQQEDTFLNMVKMLIYRTNQNYDEFRKNPVQDSIPE